MSNFNSSMVRLKVTFAFKNVKTQVFQFLYGAIKSIKFRCSSLGRLNFNSSMVRLKADQRRQKSSSKKYFNSSMVRLKEETVVTEELFDEFQFLYGAIKSKSGNMS